MPRPRADDVGAGTGARDSVRVHTRPTSSSLGFTPVRPAHPVRTKDDRDGQVSWLAGQCRSGRLLGTRVPMASGRWLTAYSCRGSRSVSVPFSSPSPGNLSRGLP